MKERIKGMLLGLVFGVAAGITASSFIFMADLTEAGKIREVAAEQQALLDKYADQNKEMLDLIDKLVAEKEDKS